MDKNVGGLDRIARLVLGGLLVLAALAGYVGALELGLTVAGLAVVVGAVLLVTGTTQRCPLWLALRVDTSGR